MTATTSCRRHFLTPMTLTAFLVTGCGDDKERPEQITKLRALGVEQTPVIAVPGSTVQLTFHLAAPSGKTITATPYKDVAFKYGTAETVTLVDTTPTETKLGSISDYTLRANFVVPADAATTAALTAKGNLRSRYGITFSDGSRNETVVGDTLIYAPDAPQTTWKAPIITIDQPTTTEISSTSAISGTIQNTNEETTRVSWFVSSGKVKNRSSKSTEWSEAGTGEQTLIFTARGRKSGAFAIKIVKTTVH